MAAYRLYFLDAKNAIQARQEFVAESDAQARTISGALWQACADCCPDYELWEAKRCVGRGNGEGQTISAPMPKDGNASLQTRVLELEELLLGSHWRIAQSERLLAATDTLRRDLDRDGTATLPYRDLTHYICAATGSKMMSLQLAVGKRLELRGSRGFGRLFDEYFAVVVPTGHCACGVAYESARQIVVPDIGASPIFAGQEALDVLRGQGVASCISTPLLGRHGRIVGMFSIHRDRVWHPLDGELVQLRQLAIDISAALADPLGAIAQGMRTAP